MISYRSCGTPGGFGHGYLYLAHPGCPQVREENWQLFISAAAQREAGSRRYLICHESFEPAKCSPVGIRASHVLVHGWSAVEAHAYLKRCNALQFIDSFLVKHEAVGRDDEVHPGIGYALEKYGPVRMEERFAASGRQLKYAQFRHLIQKADDPFGWQLACSINIWR
jgi:hypothetical protein